MKPTSKSQPIGFRQQNVEMEVEPVASFETPIQNSLEALILDIAREYLNTRHFGHPLAAPHLKMIKRMEKLYIRYFEKI